MVVARIKTVAVVEVVRKGSYWICFKSWRAIGTS